MFGSMNWKTSATGVIMIALGVGSVLGIKIAGVTGDPMALITGGFGLIFAKDAVAHLP